MADNARGIHVSPGIYTREVDVNYAVRSLGITTLGVVGETVKGPAFQPMDISNWREFQDMFGGTSTEKFRGSQYPKYELPYIAKSFLSESEQLKVVRVLGLSGYNAGPAWAIKAENNQVIAILRSRGTYNLETDTYTGTSCQCKKNNFDTLTYYVGEISGTTNEGCAKNLYNGKALDIKEYHPLLSTGDECNSYTMSSETSSWEVSNYNHGRFKIIGMTGAHASGATPDSGETGYFEYSVSLNPLDNDYILNVLGTRPDDGDAPIYVESLYDVALEQGIADGEITSIDSGLTFFQAYHTVDYCHHEPVNGIVTLPQTSLTRKNVGERYLADAAAKENEIKCVAYDYATNKPIMPLAEQIMQCGQIYTVRQYTSKDGKRHYFYAFYAADEVQKYFSGKTDTDLTNYYGNLKDGGQGRDHDYANSGNTATLVLNKADNLYYKYFGSTEDIRYVELDMNDYRSAYRYASTPWIVSNLKGDMKRVELNRMFRFHTISDGDNANYEVKVSIENIKPNEGVFDVVVRRIDDVDESVVPLEKFTRCSMIPKTSNYIAFKIGSFDGVYESKSKYITVEVNETTAAQASVPCGFLGYPVPNYSGTPISGDVVSSIRFPRIRYNTEFDEDIKNRKQYFGLSSWIGVDIDMFTFKGTKSYIDDPKYVTHGFHLDSRLDYVNNGVPKDNVVVDGVSGYVFDAVSTNSRTQVLSNPPIIDKEENMLGSIYEYTNLRKFTVYFYGGFDGWDVYRGQRTNTDGYKMTQYKGYINQESGEGYSFNKINNPSLLQLNQDGINSDWYAYLSGIRQFATPEATDINVFATPGIDYVNQKLLVQEAIEMIEEERADSIYVITTPDKPNGAGDYIDEMYSPEEAVYNLEDSEIDSNYSCTYYPWVKYLDQDNNQYIYLPPTKDAVRNFAQTDNISYPWYAPAGMSRGDVDCVRAKFITKISDEDVLYEGRINPIKTFAQDGAKIWGQKNLQINESQLNRIAVRRLMLRLRKLIAISCIGLIFEPNDPTIKQSFISSVSPVLDSIRSNRGISDYRIEVNDSLETRMNRELPVKIYIKPYNALEYITIDFIVTPEGVSFDNI